MMKKFTEEQYEAIIDAWNNSLLYDRATHFVIEYINSIGSCNYEAALAIANPKTRELAHDRYVEKEKTYVWKLNGLYLVKALSDGSIYFGSQDASMALTESQVKEWGFNPEVFDKEEF